MFIWWDGEPDKLPTGIRRLLQDGANILLISIARLWEIQIKMQLVSVDSNLVKYPARIIDS